jgi:hypothetical protein
LGRIRLSDDIGSFGAGEIKKLPKTKTKTKTEAGPSPAAKDDNFIA